MFELCGWVSSSASQEIIEVGQVVLPECLVLPVRRVIILHKTPQGRTFLWNTKDPWLLINSDCLAQEKAKAMIDEHHL